MQIHKVEITWEDGSTTVVVPETKLVADVQGTAVEELQHVTETSPSVETPADVPVDPLAEPAA